MSQVQGPDLTLSTCLELSEPLSLIDCSLLGSKIAFLKNGSGLLIITFRWEVKL